MITVSAAVAYAANRVIGQGGAIPWKIPGEQKLFKKHTENKIVVMGRLTWESIPEKYRPLPNRFNIVLTSKWYESPYFAGGTKVPSLHYALKVADALRDYDEAVLIGGQRVYEEGLPYCNKLYLTELEGIYPGDRYFPRINESEWATTSKEHIPLEQNGVTSYNFRVLERYSRTTHILAV